MIHGLQTIHQNVSELRARCTDLKVERSHISSRVEFEDKAALYNDFTYKAFFEPHALTQLVTIQKAIPPEYLHRLVNRGESQMARRNFTLWDFPAGKELLVRLYDADTKSKVRAVLTDKYQPVPHEKVLEETEEAFGRFSSDSYSVIGGVDMDDLMMYIKEERQLSSGMDFGVFLFNGETGKRGLGAVIRVVRAGKKTGILFNSLEVLRTRHVGDQSKLHDDFRTAVFALPKHRDTVEGWLRNSQGRAINWIDELKRLERPLSKEALERVTSFIATKAPETKWDFIEALMDFTEGQPSYMRDSMESFIGAYLSAA
jgi:hypothetical protein